MSAAVLSAAARPGDRPYNEDALVLGADFCGVLDGATGLTQAPPVMAPWPSDAVWLVTQVRDYLQQHLGDPSRSLDGHCRAALARCRAQWRGSQDALALPSAGIALVRRQGDFLDCFCLGDVTLSLRLVTGDFRSLPEAALTALDQKALDAAQAFRDQGHTWAEAMDAILPILQAHRVLRNRPGGYAALDLRGNWPQARTLRLPAGQVRSVLLCSDGFAQCIAFGLVRDLADLHRQSEAQGIPALLDRLAQAQGEDRACREVPRFKWMDDATGVVWVPG